MYSVAKSELFKNKLIAKFLTYHNAFPIERNKTDIKGAKSILEQLENQEKIRLLIFPEGGIFKENYKYNKKKNQKWCCLPFSNSKCANYSCAYYS